MDPKSKNQSKSLIFLKASVVALGIVFVVLFAALIILKSKKPNQNQVKEISCADGLKTRIIGEVQTMSVQGDKVVILTKLNSKTKKQEIIKFDSSCLKIINRIEFDVF